MNNVLPGRIDSLPATDARRDSVPMQRYGTAEEIAATVAFLVSDGAGCITGQNIRVDGGPMRSLRAARRLRWPPAGGCLCPASRCPARWR